MEYTISLKKYNNQKGIKDEINASICALIEISNNIDISMYSAAEALDIPIKDMEQRLTRLVNEDILTMEILEGTTIPVSMIKEYCEKELSFRNDSKRPITYQAPIPEKGKNNYS